MMSVVHFMLDQAGILFLGHLAFLFFLLKILPWTSKCPRTPLFFIIFVMKHSPDHIIFGSDCPGLHHFLFLWIKNISGHCRPPSILASVGQGPGLI